MRARAARATILALTACACAQQPPSGPIVVLEPRTTHQLVFRSPEQCRECHPQHVADWEGSMHAYAMTDPVFHALADVVANDFQGQVGQLCTQCHTVPGFLGNETPVVHRPDGNYEQRTQGLSPVAMAGVSCDVCHQITGVLEPMNGSVQLSPDGTIRGPIADPMPNPFHTSVESPLHRTGQVCVGCHSFVLPIVSRPVPLEQTAHEWQDEYLAGGGTQSCQDCHMQPRMGQAAVGGPMRTIHAHTFAAVDIALVDFPDRARQRMLVEDLLAHSVEMTATITSDAGGAPTGASVSLHNLAGHAIPSGVSVERRAWVEATLVDAAGTTVWSTGQLDANGDLMDGLEGRALDPQLVWLGTVAYDDENPSVPRRVVEFSHRASLVEEHLLRPLATDVHALTFPPLATGHYELRVRLLMRPMQPATVRALEGRRINPLAPGLADVMPTFEMATHTLAFDAP